MTHLVVIGYTGQVASELRFVRLPTGWRLTALDRQLLDLTKQETFARKLTMLRPNVIVNAAAYTGVDKAEQEKDLAMQVNGRAPGELAQVAATLNIPFLHISTDYVFDGSASRPYTEQDTANPLNIYGRSKRAGENAILESDARAVILRTSWVFSRFGSSFVHTMMRLARTRDELSIVSDQHGGPTPARDIAETLVMMAQRLIEEPQAPTGIFHYCGQPATTWANFAATVFDKADWLARKPKITPIPTSEYPTPATRPLSSVLDCSKLDREYGIQQPDWHNGLVCVLDYLKPEMSNIEAS
jgi:dTDP-4-dehydrorhamnose reductase